MDSTNSGSLLDSVSAAAATAAGYLPGLTGGLLVLIAGWLLARIARRATQKLATVCNRLLERAFPSGRFAGARVSSLTVTVLAEIVFWIILLAAVTVAARIAGLITISGWLDRITAQVPNLVAAIVIVAVGFFLGVFVREQIAPRRGQQQSGRSQSVARLAQGLIVAIALLVGLDQIGIDVALPVALTVVVTGALLAGFAAAFALGSRRHCGNLIGARSARRQLSIGTRIRIGEYDGEILEFGATHIALDTEAGRTLVPGSLVDELAIVIVPPADEDGGVAG